MQFKTLKSTLQSELSRFSGIVERKSTLAVLEQVLLILDKQGILQIAGTDLDTSLRSSFPVDKIEDGTASVSCRRLLDFVRLLPEGEVNLKKEKNDWVTVKSGKSKCKIPGGDPLSFPSIPKDSPGALFQIPSNVLKKIILGTGYAVPPEEDNRFTFKGAQLELSGSTAKMVSTDGHRLALSQGELEDELLEDLEILIPHNGLKELSRLLTDYEGSVNVNSTENQIYFSTGDRVLTVRMLVGRFPDYRKVPVFDPEFVMDRITINSASELALNIRRAALATGDRGAGILFEFCENELKLSAQDAELGESFESFDIEYSGPNIQLLVNAKYVTDFLGLIENNPFVFGVKGEGFPVNLTAERNGISYNGIIMPMRL